MILNCKTRSFLRHKKAFRVILVVSTYSKLESNQLRGNPKIRFKDEFSILQTLLGKLPSLIHVASEILQPTSSPARDLHIHYGHQHIQCVVFTQQCLLACIHHDFVHFYHLYTLEKRHSHNERGEHSLLIFALHLMIYIPRTRVMNVKILFERVEIFLVVASLYTIRHIFPYNRNDYHIKWFPFIVFDF